ncbi:hypothetical protein GCM10010353_02240 [Streptomyces chryseus]|uniref:Uncharacterized protein n=1 Tax=Streptomyces chryseus TaxID=68186 RepID=A0ABQ3DFI8_9ACTN|nr:hypothetical protein GCM10010353_02240 [Streptomyces chryseus]GHA90432.1 hypothetical protein GCM10010346_11250 [Streptomyces chryseus]
MVQYVVEEELGGEPLALEATLHVGEGQDDCVDLTARHEGAELLKSERGCAVCHGKFLLRSAGSHKVLLKTIAWEGETARWRAKSILRTV